MPDNNEPTTDNIADALARAKELVKRNHANLIQALAEGTTTAQCQGVQGFKVFRDVRAAVEAVLEKNVSLTTFSDTASEADVITALEQAYLVVKS